MKLAGKRILLIRLSDIKEIIFAIPLANLLKNEGAVVDWLVSDDGYDILNENPCVNNAVLASAKNLFKIREQKYDIVLDLQENMESFFWMHFSGSKRKIASRHFLGCEAAGPVFSDFKTHAAYNYCKFAKYLGINSLKIEITLPKSKMAVVLNAKRLLKGQDKNKLNLMIAPEETGKKTFCNLKNREELISGINKEKFNIVLLGQKKYKEKGGFINLSGKINSLETIEILKSCDILISSNDTITSLGWAALKPKIISIQTSNSESRYMPLGIKHIVLTEDLKNNPRKKKISPQKCEFFSAQAVLDTLDKAERGLSWTK